MKHLRATAPSSSSSSSTAHAARSDGGGGEEGDKEGGKEGVHGEMMYLDGNASAALDQLSRARRLQVH